MKKLILALFLLSISFSANADELINFYEIKDVPISQSGDTTLNMRDKAITAGQRSAMDILQERMKGKHLISDKKDITDAQINEAIDSIEVRDEKIYTKAYKAKLNVTFTPRTITKIFGVPFVKPTPVPDKLLVLPILNDDEGTKIWRHKWWEVVQKLKQKDIILPLGDLEDVRSFTREDYSVRDFRNLLKLQKKYKATAILLVSVEQIKAENSINMSIEKIKKAEVETYDYELAGKGNESEDQLYALAANELLRRISNNNFDSAYSPVEEEAQILPPPPNMNSVPEKGIRNIDVNPKNTLQPEVELNPQPVTEEPIAVDPNLTQMTDIYVIANDLVAWGRIRSKITNTQLIKNLRIKSFTAGKAFITLSHLGEFTDVVTALENSGLQVSNNGKYWEVREKAQ